MTVEKRSSWDLSTVDYSFNINFSAASNWETESNKTLLTADSISVGDPIMGSLMESNDVDYYAVDIVQAGYYSIAFEHAAVTKGEWKISIVDNTGNDVDYFFSSLSDTKSNKNFVNLASGRYYIMVEKRSYSDLSTTDYSLTVSPAVIQNVHISKVTKPKKKQLKVTWKKVSNVTGYEISIARNKKFTKGVKTVNVAAAKSKYTFKKLKSKKTYYVRMRAYVLEDNKYYYGEYSTCKKIKVK